MGDLGEPPVSVGFSDEVALSRRGGYTGLDPTIAGIVRKLDWLSLLANAVNPAVVITFPVVHNKRTCYLLKRLDVQPTHLIDDVNRMLISHAQFQDVDSHLLVDSILYLRSHFEEKPYKCHWPGCEKRFAREHDCKRH